MTILEELKAEICIGVVASEIVSPMQRILDAGFSHFEATTALDNSKGDVEKALTLLATGWTPPAPAVKKAVAVCPFTGAMANGSGGCPFGKGTDTSKEGPINTVVGLITGTRPTGAAVKVLGSELQQQLDSLLIEDANLCCPITLLLLREPMVASDGFVYEAEAVRKLIDTQEISPVTSEKLGSELFPAEQRAEEVMAFREQRAGELLDFAEHALMVEPTMSNIALERARDYLQVLGAKNFPVLANRVAKLQ